MVSQSKANHEDPFNHILKWIIITGFIVAGLFLIDLLFIERTFLTSFDDGQNVFKPISPFYAFLIPAISYKIILPTSISIVFIALIIQILKNSSNIHNPKTIILLFVFTVTIRASFAWIRSSVDSFGSGLIFYMNEGVIFDVPKVTNVRMFLESYINQMPSLSMNGHHYPPGYALFLKFLANIGGYSDMASIMSHIGWFGWCILIIGSSAVIPLYLMTKRMFGYQAAVGASSLFVLTPNLIMFGAVSLDSLFTLFALWTLMLIFKGLGDHTNNFCLFFAGLVLGITSFLSFSALPLGFLIALLVLTFSSSNNQNFTQKFINLIIIFMGFFAIIILLYLTSGFNLIKCFLVARELHEHQLSSLFLENNENISNLRNYIFMGSYLSFAIYSNFAIIGIWLRNVTLSLKNGFAEYKNEHAIALIIFIFLLIIGISGLYLMETERIWSYLTAFIIISVAGEISKIQNKNLQLNLILILCSIGLVTTVLLETLLFTIW